MVNRVIVGAHYGTRDWLAQRVTAVDHGRLHGGVCWLLIASRPPFTYETWKALFAQGWMRVATLLFALSLAWHAWVGVRDILMDYVKHAACGSRCRCYGAAARVLRELAIEILWR